MDKQSLAILHRLVPDPECPVCQLDGKFCTYHESGTVFCPRCYFSTRGDKYPNVNVDFYIVAKRIVYEMVQKYIETN